MLHTYLHYYGEVCSSWQPLEDFLTMQPTCQNPLVSFFCPSPLPSAGRHSWVLNLLEDQRGIEPPPAVCQRHKSAAIPTAPRGRVRINPVVSTCMGSDPKDEKTWLPRSRSSWWHHSPENSEKSELQAKQTNVRYLSPKWQGFWPQPDRKLQCELSQ